MQAPTPWHMRCPGCRRSIRAPRVTVPLIAGAAILAIPIGIWTQRLIAAREWYHAALVFVGAVVILDFLASLLVVSFAELSAPED
jgi:hypothetical protein